MFSKVFSLVSAVGLSLMLLGCAAFAGEGRECSMQKSGDKCEMTAEGKKDCGKMDAGKCQEHAKGKMEKCCGDGSVAAADGKTEAVKPKEVGNTVCPISGGKVGSMQKGAHVDHKGFRVGLCCNGCKAKFLKDADANLKKAQDSVKKTEK